MLASRLRLISGRLGRHSLAGGSGHGRLLLLLLRLLLLILELLLLILLLLGSSARHLLQFTVTMQHVRYDILRHAQMLQVENVIGSQMKWQIGVVNKVNQYVFADAALVHFEHFRSAKRQRLARLAGRSGRRGLRRGRRGGWSSWSGCVVGKRAVPRDGDAGNC